MSDWVALLDAYEVRNSPTDPREVEVRSWRNYGPDPSKRRRVPRPILGVRSKKASEVGRHYITLRDSEGSHTKQAGAWLLIAVSGKPEGVECSHLNGDRLDNRLSNLAWETHATNMERRKRC